MNKILNKLLNNPKSIFIYLLRKTAVIWPDKLYLSLLFRLMMGKWINWKNPQTFNEKLQWLKLYNRRPEYTEMVDKLAVKKLVARVIGSEYVVPVYAVWNCVEDIDISNLPNKFVLKTTHGGGGTGVVICRDKAHFDLTEAKKRLKRSMRSDIYKNYREWPYKNVPKKIFAEALLEDKTGCDLCDYKMFCFDGKVEFFKVDCDRFTAHRANYYKPDFTLLPYNESDLLTAPELLDKKPENFNQMLIFAKMLAKSIPFVRIDFYNVNGHVKFGEITFYPASGLGVIKPEGSDAEIGRLLKLPPR